MAWTHERNERLAQLWADGFSASQIAAELGGITRNAVIGKASRLGLPARVASKNRAPYWDTQENGEPKPKPKRKRAAQTRKLVTRLSNYGNRFKVVTVNEPDPIPMVNDMDIPVSQRRTFMELRPCDCHWPVGHPGGLGFFFCAAPVMKGKPYCAAHCARAYAPARSNPPREFVFAPRKAA